MKKLPLIIIALFLAQSTIAQTEPCKVLLEKISGSYTGNCQNGLANGKGKSIGEDTYTGFFKDGLPDGKGKYVFKNGDSFQGYWKNGLKNGNGKFEYTLNGEKQSLVGYWKNGEYAGLTDPGISYKVTSVSGIADYKINKKESVGEHDNEVIFSIYSAFTEFAPSDLKIENSTGQIVRSGKKIVVNQYTCPLHCEISYSILVANSRKQCRFIIEIIEAGKYTIALSND